MFTRRVTTFAVCCATFLLAASGCASEGGASPTPTATSPAPTFTTSPTPTPTPSAFITIDAPAAGATVSVPVTASGTANTFEAALTVDALNEAGDFLCIRNVMATSGSGTPGTWETTLGFAPESESVDMPVTLRAYEISAKDGSRVNLVERRITVSAKRPPIMLTSPICGDTVAPGGALAVQGLATVFEASLTIELRDASGTVVFTDNLTTEVGNEESRFSEIVTLPAGLTGGFYDLVAFNLSAKDGSIENEFPVQIKVQS